jgi:hypothetical protein
MQKTLQAINQSVFEPYRKMQESVRLMSRQMSAALRAHQSALKSISAAIAPMLDSHWIAQQNVAKQIADATAPSGKFQEQISEVVSQIANARDNSFIQALQALVHQMQDYHPDVQQADDGIVIDGESFTESAIAHSVTQQAVLTCPSSWASLSPKVRWILLQILLPLFVSILGNYISSQIGHSGLLHQQKEKIRAIKQEVKASRANSIWPFVSQESLAVYAAPRRHSAVIAYLPFRTEITILECRNKKRWMLVEWESSGETHCGWVLGRYVFRPSKYRKTATYVGCPE